MNKNRANSMGHQKLVTETNLSLESTSTGSMPQDSTPTLAATEQLSEQSSNVAHETAVRYDDTAEIPLPKAQVRKKAAEPSARETSTKVRPKSIRPRTRSGFVIDTEPADELEQQAELDESVWESSVRGMPSWLTSLIIHLSLILLLALLSVGSDGRKIVDLLATSADQTTIEPYAELDIELDIEELETLADDSEFTEANLSEPEEIPELLDEAFMTSDSSLDSQSDLLDAVASESLFAEKPSNPNQSAAQFFGVEGAGSDFVYIVDCSGSMAEYGRWTSAVRELKKSINDLKSDQKFLILLYNTGFVAMNNKAELVSSNKVERSRAMRWLSRNSPNNWTFCAQALTKALTLKPDAIFLLSDGEFDDRRDVFKVLDRLNNKRRLISSNENQIPVHTIALGSHHGRFTMKRIADENSGEFRLVDQ